jgi:hypothetical protein
MKVKKNLENLESPRPFVVDVKHSLQVIFQVTGGGEEIYQK